jgi:hypothetical protein
MDVIFILVGSPRLGICMCVSLSCHHRAFFSLFTPSCSGFGSVVHDMPVRE